MSISLDESFELFRITVVGAGNSGKTCLINAFVNNFCPTVYTETTDPTFYYKCLHLAPENKEKEGAEPFQLMVEIEDTYSSSLREGMDSDGRVRDAKTFLDMERTTRARKHKDDDGKESEVRGIPFVGYDPPKVGKHNPLAKGRMGFMIVFDCNVPETYTEAIRLYLQLEDSLQKNKIHLKPIVFLVANKIDKDPMNESIKRTRATAQLWATDKNVRFAEVAAPELRKVKGLFRRMLNDIRENKLLWGRESGLDGEEEAKPLSLWDRAQSQSVKRSLSIPAGEPSMSESKESGCTVQ